MTATGESVNNPPDGHLNGHAAARAKEAAAIVIPETEDAPAQRLSREEKKAIIDELANMTALEFRTGAEGARETAWGVANRS